MEQFALDFVPERRVFTLREVSDAIRAALERGLSNIWISGEISGTKVVSSGHCYFTLKDSDAQIKCVCWKLTWWRLKFRPKDGVQVVIRGRVDIYEQRSEYQFVVEAIEPQGHGALQLAFEQLKQKLLNEGLFDAARKRPLPRFPRRIGIVSSPQGAVIRDFIEILSRRFPGLHIRLFAAKVQGPGSIDEVRRGLEFFGRSQWAELVVLARGGGSLEDLWTFNEEAVARAIAQSPIPVVSAIGHETDVTIADFVADLRAPTPSAAAEMIVCTRQELLDRIDSAERHATRAIRYRLAVLARRLHEQAIGRAHTLLERSLARRTQRVDDALDRMAAAVRRDIALRERQRRALEARLSVFDMRPRLRRDRERLDQSSFRILTLVRAQLDRQRRRHENATARLSQLNPRSVLARGYAIVLDPNGAIVKAAQQVPPGTDVAILLEKDTVHAQITKTA
jgi:exodeoxyribonuclease VII large subunit